MRFQVGLGHSMLKRNFFPVRLKQLHSMSKCSLMSRTSFRANSLFRWLFCRLRIEVNKYKNFSRYFNFSQCNICPAGHKCPSGSVNPVQCTKLEEYASFQGSKECKLCPGGYQCPESAPVPCKYGYYSTDGLGVCLLCPAGKQCKRNNVQPKNNCKAGYYSLIGMALCLPCPKGSKCDNPQMPPIVCRSGEFSKEGSTTCEKCPAGFKCPQPSSNPFRCPTRTTYSPEASLQCLKCPQNHQCPTPAQTPRKCDSFTHQSAQGDGFCVLRSIIPEERVLYMERYLTSCTSGQYLNLSDVCIDCPAGKFCNDGYYYIRDCPVGTYSLLKDGSCTLCPAGYKCPSNDSSPISCSSGQFSLAGATECIDCPPGFQCPNLEGNDITMCRQGKYSVGGLAACVDCPAGKYCNQWQAIDCQNDMYSPLGQYDCLWCPAGYSCSAGAATACNNGEYSLYKMKSCYSCPAGHKCPQKGAAPIPCNQNQYSSGSTQTCSLCSASQYSGIGWSSCQNIPSGFHKGNNIYQVIIPGSFGKYVNNYTEKKCSNNSRFCQEYGTVNSTLCPAGHYCLRINNNYVDKIPCEAGRYASSVGSRNSNSNCSNCTQGNYCLPGTVTPIPCPAGFYCGASASVPTPCGNGKWRDAQGGQSAGDCTTCPNGFVCKDGFKKFCPAGYYCTSGSSTACPVEKYQPLSRQETNASCKDCPYGHYCDVVGLAAPKPCPPGYYTSSKNTRNLSDCQKCDKGACPGVGLSNDNNDGRFPCAPGHYCEDGSSNPMGTPCPVNTFGDRQDLKSASECTNCPQGFYCPIGSTWFGYHGDPNDIETTPGTKPIPCPRGWYCPAGAAAKCPAGSWNPTRGAISLESCKPCPAGFSCAIGGALTLCPQNHYCPPGTQNPIACPDGTIAPNFSGTTTFQTRLPTDMGATTISDCLPIHPGKYGPQMTDCPANTYNPFFYGVNLAADSSNAALLRGCYTAPAGYWTNSLLGQLTPIPCPIGYFSQAGKDCQACSDGYYCDELGLSKATMLSEKACPAGYYCINAEMIECPIGQFCTAGQSAPTDCASGTWSFTTRWQSDPCPNVIAGYYHDTVAKQAKPCPKGYYCLPGQSSGLTNPCPAGTFNRYQGAKTSDYCVPCPIGFKCQNVGTQTPRICPPGHYCPAGSSTGKMCPSGTFSNSKGLRALQDCQQCWAGSYCQNPGLTKPSQQCNEGYYCQAGSSQSSKTICPAHAFCPKGTAITTKCPPGKYNKSTGQTQSTNCILCQPGKYCTGQSDPQDCDEGYYCTGGSSTPKQNVAKVQHFAVAGADKQTQCQGTSYNFKIAQKECKACPNGYKCSGGALYDCYTQATTGDTSDDNYNQYCVAGSSTNCSNGKMNLHPNAQSSSQCVNCLEGFKCIFGATKLTNPATILTTGKYSGGLHGWIGTQQSTPKGYFAQNSQASYAFPCPAGKINSNQDQLTSSCVNVPGEQSSPVGGYPYGIKCMDGFQCVSQGSIHWNTAPCEAGNKCKDGQKTQCPRGEYQPLAGKDYCLKCPKGFYCPNLGTHTPTICGRGKYCAEGVDSQTDCLPGTFNPSEGLWKQDQCLKCQGGKFCITGTHTPVACDAGYYCTISATNAQQNICPIGSFCPAGSDYPTPCTPGKYCPTQGMSSATQNCDAGYYCVLGAKVRNPTVLATEGGAQCPAGSYCLAGSTIPTRCPSGKYSNATGATSDATCQQCDASKYCDQPGSTTIKGTCSQGFYCPLGSSSRYQIQCPAGSKCQASQSTHTDCSTLTPLSYQPRTRSNSCITCPPGHTCTSTTTTQCDFTGSTSQNKYCFQGVEINCPAGQIIDYVGASSSSACIKCPPGYYCPNIDGQLKLKICSSGEKCDFGKSSVTASDACDSGSFCPPGGRIKPCTAGKYCASTGLTAPQGQCDAGYTCPQGSTSNQHTDCPAGSYCPAGSAFGFLCPPGTYSNKLRQDELKDCEECTSGQHCKGRGLTAPQTACEAGYFCPAGSVTEFDSLCGAGNKCPANQSAQIKCPINQYQGAKGQDDCLTCPERYECNKEGLSQLQICPVGYYCPSGAAKVKCPIGTYNPNKGMKQASECLPCKRGFYCATQGLSSPTNTCDPGYVCISKAQTATPSDGVTGKICPIGYYCEGGSQKQTPCPPGKYGDATGLVSQNSCKLCKKGKYCPKFGLTQSALDADNSLRCLAGFFCNGGAKIPTPKDLLTEGGRPCSVGYYCPIGTQTEQPCQKGFFNPYEGASSCQICPIGYKCPNTSMSEPQQCDAGHFCGGQTITPQDCPAGKFSSKKTLGSANQCTLCLPGFYCTGGKQTTDGQCSPGYVCPQGASTSTPPGNYSKSSPSPSQCPAGHFCQQGTSVPKPCPVGFYQPQTGQSTCEKCPQWHYCQKIGIKSIAEMNRCADGFHCISGAKVAKPIDGGITGNPCEAGNYCTQGEQIPCAAGTYQPRSGSSACQDCPPGYYCPIGSQTPIDCPIKSYCPVKSQQPKLCPDGTYNQKTGLESDSQCVPCPSGVYCQNGVIVGNCEAGYYCKSGAKVKNPTDTDGNNKNYSNGQCPIGHFCTSGTKTPTQCSGDKIRETPGAASDTDCQTCKQGYYCIAGFSTGILCPPGFFCIEGSTQPAECPLNTYNQNPNGKKQEDCKSCNSPSVAGTTYCNDTRITSLQAYKCPPGHFCIDGIDDSDNKLKDINICPKGTFSANRGKRSACETCTGGYFCNEGQMSPILCKEKRECPAGSFEQTVCRAGRYCPQGTGIGITCPAGFYCPVETEIPLKCPDSTYCIAGSKVPTPCPAGTTATLNPNNFDLSSGCQNCDPGTYISTSGKFDCLDCEAGYVCTGGTSSRYPTIAATHNGYKCKKGHYCPTGSHIDTQCPKGTYNPSTGKSSLSDCFPCDSNTYNFLTGQDGCLPCPPSATSQQGSQTCTCKGLHRVYQQESGSCVCQTGYRAQTDNYNYSTSLDCVIIASKSCGSSADSSIIRDQLGQCVDVNDCEDQCGISGGQRISGIGICQCKSLTDVDSVCNQSCVNSQPKIQVKADGKVQIRNSDGTVVEKNILADNSNIAGNWSCPHGGCKIVSMKATSSGQIAASYEPLTSLFPVSLLDKSIYEQIQSGRELEEERSLQSAQIQSAIVCIQQQDTFIFEVQLDTSDRKNSVYPIYVRNSILNTDSNFDNSELLNLEKRILFSPQIISFFAYQFTKPGVFVFATNKNQKAYTLVRVMKTNQSCPNQTQFIQPMTEENLLAVGVQKQTNIPATTNWALYIGMLLMFIIILLGFFTLISFLHSRAIEREKEALLQSEQKVPYCQKVLLKCFRRLKCCCKKKKNRVLNRNLSSFNFSFKDEDEADLEIQQRGLTIQDLKQIRGLAGQLNMKLQGVLNASGFGKNFDDIHKQAISINKRLKRIADQNNLKQNDNILDMRQKRKEKEFYLRKNQLFDSDDDDSKQDQASTQESNTSAQNNKSQQDDRDINNKIGKYMGKLQAEAEGRYNEDVDRRRQNLDIILASQYNEDLTNQEKKQLLMDHQTDIARINNLLKVERDKQEDALRRKLKERANKNQLIRQRIQQEEEKKRELNNLTKEQIGAIKQNAQKKLQEISDYEKLKIKEINNLKLQLYKEREEYKAKTKQDLQKALKKKSNKLATQSLLAQFDQREKKSLQILEDKFRKREEYVKDNIQDIAKDRMYEIKQQIQKEKEQILKKQREKSQVVDKKINELKNMEECDYINKEIEKIDDQNQIQRRNALKQLRDYHTLEMERLNEEEQQKLNEIERSGDRDGNNGDLLDTDDVFGGKKIKGEVTKQVRLQIHNAITNRKELQEKLNKLKDIQLSPQELEQQKQQLLRQLSEVDKSINILEKQANAQRSVLQERLYQRRGKVRQKMISRQNFQKKRLKQLEKNDKQELLARQDKLTEQFDEQVKHIKRTMTGDEIPYAVEKALDTKQNEELNILLAIMLSEKAQRLKLILHKLFQDRLDEFQLVKEEFTPKYNDLEEDRIEGRLTQQEYNKKYRQIKDEQTDQKKNLQLKYFEAQHAAQAEVFDDLDIKHDHAIHAMKKKQAEEKTQVMKMVLERDQKLLREIQRERREQMDKDIGDYKNELQRNLKKKMQEREKERAKLLKFQRESQQTLAKIERLYHEEGIKREKEQRQRLENKRKQIQAQKDKIESQMKRRNDLCEQEKQKLIQEHYDKLRELNKTLETERMRQSQLVSDKLKDRKLIRERYKLERDRKLAVFKLHYEQLLENKMRDIIVKEKEEQAGAPSSFEILTKEYGENEKIFQKMTFPNKLLISEGRVREKRPQQLQIGHQTPKVLSNFGSPRVFSRRGSFAFGRSQNVRPILSKNDPQNLIRVLEKLGDIETILERRKNSRKY